MIGFYTQEQEGCAMSSLHEPEASLPRRLVSFPPDGPPAAARQSWLYTALLGNGRVLACLDATAAIAQLFYPQPDAGPLVQALLFGLQVLPDPHQGLPAQGQEEEAAVTWLAESAWIHELTYVDQAAVIRCQSTHAALPIQLEQTLAVHHAYDVLLDDIRLTNLADRPLTVRLVLYAAFDPGSRQRGSTCYVEKDSGALLFFADDCYIAAHCDQTVYGAGCGRRGVGSQEQQVFEDASAGRFNRQVYAIGQVHGSICYDIGQAAPAQSVHFQVRLCFGRSLDDIHTLLHQQDPSRLQIDAISQWWQQHYLQELAFLENIQIRAIAQRALITLRLLTDASSGGMLAAPECDPDFLLCGGYGFCWPRDGALVGHTLDMFHCFDQARMFYDWALGVQAACGVWYQRYALHGTLAPTWGLIQFDETGVMVWAICRHIQLSGDLAYGRKVLPRLLQACQYLHSELDPETGLAPITIDLWEERVGISTYACACTWGAFHEYALLAGTLGLTAEAEVWASAADLLKQAIEQHLWDASLQRFIRGIKVPARDCGVQHDHRAVLAEETPSLFCRDTTIDASLLGLSVPFAVFPADDQRIQATAEAIATHLTSPAGGISRYQGDTYRGGNPWIICTLWLALHFIQSGSQEKGRQLYTWALQHRSRLDLFPEQIDKVSGQPCWVNPLGWSHAMFLLATRAASQCGFLPPEAEA
jgi:oligosaccharide amylase